MKIALQVLVAGSVVLASGVAHAQLGGGGRGRGNASAVFPLPEGVKRVISLDAYNTLIAQTEDDRGQPHYTLIPIRHVYSGGIAALFGGVSIPTAQFVSPGAMGNGGGNNGNFGVRGLGGNNQNQNQNSGLSFNGSGVNNGFSGANNGSFTLPGGAIGMNQTSIIGPNGTSTPLANGPFDGPNF